MADAEVIIVGAGIVGIALAHLFATKGHRVTIFEKGPEYPYPYAKQFEEEIKYSYTAWYAPPADVGRLTQSGSYKYELNNERLQRVGGLATRWHAVTPRMPAKDFKLATAHGYADDWPISYEDVEPYYCRAERHIGVSGTDADNPFAPPRSQPFPMPAFELAWDDRLLAERLSKVGVTLHTTPQARASTPYDGRSNCLNFAACQVCPTGARYAPGHHLSLAMATGRVELHANTSVRSILVGPSGLARGVVVRRNDSSADEEVGAKLVFVTAGEFETPRLLLLSKLDPHGQVGRHLMMHHFLVGHLDFDQDLYATRFGGATAQSWQWIDPPWRSKKEGGFRLDCSSYFNVGSHLDITAALAKWKSGRDIVAGMRPLLRCRRLVFQAEAVANPDKKHVTLSKERDRFGDPLAHVHYDIDDFDRGTYQRAKGAFATLKAGTRAIGGDLPEDYGASLHYMGTCRMGTDPRASVVDAAGGLHGTKNVFLAGGSVFVTGSAVNPTLTMLALAFRSADAALERGLL